VAINVSTRQLLDPDFFDTVLDALNRYGLSSSSLEIEITETALMIDEQGCLDTLNRLENAGHIVTIDDFGTGLSSLAKLVQLPVKRLKIDRMFTRDIEKSEKMRSVIKSIVRMAHELNLDVICEGIERDTQLPYLKETDCDAIQGFMMSRAKDAASVTLQITQDGNVKQVC